ncbi:recombinase family protein [Clostridium botulinum C]|uniref:Recombinase family protein n=2 Tax=Clostridium botulinum TaxID=1491 RepID=A0A9Q4XW59_CLOBO|nr:recombinase family protein [Clostridium botulinum]KMJ93083.1 integrase [Clostridium botulinum C str. Stockholm]MCD3195715.1 recombinase family protein [Clostridium botulinum C]MCD3201131.1 recombinase family protein [Clostridium botulinum C]MCD3206617.1 recombinase family protein [Clostridium botulinum C]MCD3209384.1 recombinase family protein [Clostridium botulinum C]
MKFGYARVSTTHQNLDLQIDELNKYNCDEIITDKISGAKVKREGLDNLLLKLRKGDTLIVWKLDRLGRTMKQLVDLMEYFNKNNIQFISIKDGIDTATTVGRFMFHVLGAVAEMEREVINERRIKGVESAKARGREGGRKKAHDSEKIKTALKMVSDGYSKKEICDSLGIARTTLYRYIKEYEKDKLTK